MNNTSLLADKAQALAHSASDLAQQIQSQCHAVPPMPGANISPFVFGLTVFVLACIIGYFVVWKVTPALHTPLMSVTNAISGIIIVGAIIALGSKGNDTGAGTSHLAGLVAVIIASVNIFGGFLVTQRMLKMFHKKK